MYQDFNKEFFTKDVLEVAPLLPGNIVVRVINGVKKEFQIVEVEAYRGTEDLACHACKGRTKRTEIMYHEGGHIYMYLIYGMYWMFNIVTGPKDDPQAILIRSVEGAIGPGRVSRVLEMDKSFYGENIFESDRISIIKGINPVQICSAPRIGIDYAGEYWSKMPWRFYLNPIAK